MLVLVLVLAAVLVVVAAGSVAYGARRGFDDVERFHRARGITSGWAEQGVTRPVLVDEHGQERAEDSARG